MVKHAGRHETSKAKHHESSSKEKKIKTSSASKEKNRKRKHGLYPDSAFVTIKGLEKKPDLNGQIGIIQSFDGGDERRYTVKVSGTLLAIRERNLYSLPTPATSLSAPPQQTSASPTKCQTADSAGVSSPGKPPGKPGVSPGKARQPQESLASPAKKCRSASVAGVSSGEARKSPGARQLSESSASPAKCRTVTPAAGVIPRNARRKAGDDAFTDLLQSDTATEDEKARACQKLPLGQLTEKGELVPSYSWVRVPSVASLPPGLEIRASLGKTKCARIPSVWRLQVVAEGQVDAYRCDVGQNTLVRDAIIGAAACFGWEPSALDLKVDGKSLDVQDGDTIGSTAMFGRKLIARKRVLT